LQAAFFVQYPQADKQLYAALFKTLQDTPITPDVGQGILKQIKERREALKLSEKAFRVAQGLDSVENLEEYIKLWENKDDHQPTSDDDYVSLDLTELIEHAYAEQGLRWRLECLNKSLGSLRPGDFGFIFARPETGKTTFLASEITNMLSHGLSEGKGPIVWLNNEEQGAKVMLRIYQAYFGVTTAQLMSNVKKYRDEFMARFHGKFYLIDRASIDKRFVEKLVYKLKPSLVVYDQLTKIKGFKADRPDLQLGEIFQWARELAKGSHAAIGVSQADGTAERVRYLTMEHVANAKTAVQAEADWILGIGKDHDMEYARFLNISKNKLLGDKDSLPDLRHGRFEVLIEPSVARYRDVMAYD
jgi:replicative DNA helicase